MIIRTPTETSLTYQIRGSPFLEQLLRDSALLVLLSVAHDEGVAV